MEEKTIPICSKKSGSFESFFSLISSNFSIFSPLVLCVVGSKIGF